MNKQRKGGNAARARLILKAGSSLFVVLIVGLLATGLLDSCRTMSLVDLIKKGEIENLKERILDGHSINQVNENGQTMLHIAALQDNGEIISFILGFKPDTEIRDKSGRTPFVLAVENRCWNAAAALAEGGAYLFAKNPSGLSVYDMAEVSGIEYVRTVISEKTADQKDEDGCTALHIAARRLNVEAVSYIAERASNLSVRDFQGKTALMHAYENPNEEAAARIAAHLLISGAEPSRGEFSYFEAAVLKRNFSIRFADGKTPLHIAASNGSIGFVQYLLGRGAQVNAKDVSSSTPLHEAVISGSAISAQMLIDAGADVNVQNSLGNTALHLVMPIATRGPIFDALLAAGANPNLKDVYGETPLHIAARVAMTREIIQKLIDAGVDVDERNKRGVTPLALAIERNQMQQVNLFVELGADIHAEGIDGSTAFTKAIASGIEMTRAVLVGDNVYSRDSAGRTSLHIAAAERAHPEIIQYIISMSVDVNARDRRGNTALLSAVANNSQQVGEILLSSGADVFATNMDGDSPLRIAFTRREGREVWILTSNVIRSSDGAGNTPLHLAAEWNIPQVIPLIFEKGGNLNAKNDNGETPIFTAAKADSAEVLSALLSTGRGTSADINARDFLGNSALFTSVMWQAKNAAAVLLNFDSRTNDRKLINAKNLAGKTPLHEAARIGNREFVAMLLNAGADANATDETGSTPLMDAVNVGSTESIGMLLRYGASPTIQDMYGRNALHAAVERGGHDIITMLSRAGANPMSRDAYGITPLALAFRRSPEITSAVLGGNVSIADSDGNTPLHIAVEENMDDKILMGLIAQGFPLNSRNRRGKTALFVALERENESAMRALLQAGCDPFLTDSEGRSVAGIILSEKEEYLQLIVQHVAGKTDAMGDNLLHYAARFASEDIVQKVRNMQLVDPYAKNIEGETPADIAARWERPEIQAILK